MEEDVADEAEQERHHLLPVERPPSHGKRDRQEKQPEQDQLQERSDLAPPEIDQALGNLVADSGGEGPYPSLRFTGWRQCLGWGRLYESFYLHDILLWFRAGFV